jgi:hypothetical protein
MEKSELLRWLQEEIRGWDDLLDQIGPARMELPGVNGDWTMKDMVAHQTGWNRWQVDRFQAALDGVPEPAPPWPAALQADDEINAWIYETYRVRSVQDVLEETRQVLWQLVTIVENLPEDARIEHLEPAFYLVWLGDERYVASEFFNHYHDDHEADVRAWMEREGIGKD